MSVITKIENKNDLKRLIKVAAYARVSAEKDTMLHSLSTQVSHYSKYIQQNPEWLYVGVYSDYGFTGTSEDRHDFQQMIKDAKAGKIDLIITKSVSRFARNTVTLLQVVRELKAINVGIYFEEFNINTLTADGELMLSIYASIAQEESRSCSENCLWRIKREFEQGRLYGGANCYGYKLINRKYVLVPEQAEIIKKIFDLYINGKGMVAITKILNNEGIPTLLGYKWSKASIQDIIHNYNYTGDLVLQKTYRSDHITKKTKINRGERDKYLVENDHEPIISKETYELAQQISEKRLNRGIRNSMLNCKKYLFTGMIRCSICGTTFRHKIAHGKDIWRCNTFDQYGKENCASKQIPQDIIENTVKEVLNIKTLKEEVVKEQINKIIAYPNNIMEFYLSDGSIKQIQWKDHSRRDSWTPEMREKARQKAIENLKLKK